jgi:stress response protein YsnF
MPIVIFMIKVKKTEPMRCSRTQALWTGLWFIPKEVANPAEKGTEMRDAPKEKELVVPLASEELRLDKREISTGKVRVQTVVETVDELARATVEEESLDVQRVPVGKVVPEPPCIRIEGDVIPVLAEKMIVEKRLVLVEEVHIRRTKSSRLVEMPVKLRKQKAVIDPTPADSQPTQKDIKS